MNIQPRNVEAPRYSGGLEALKLSMEEAQSAIIAQPLAALPSHRTPSLEVREGFSPQLIISARQLSDLVRAIVQDSERSRAR